MVVILDRVQQRDIVLLWPYLEPLFRRACEADPTGLTPDEIRADALEGRRQIWTLANRDRTQPLLAAFATASHGNTVTVGPLAGDDMEEWLDRLPLLEAYAKEAGFTAFRIEGRPGWSKVLRPYGYELARVILEKAL